MPRKKSTNSPAPTTDLAKLANLKFLGVELTEDQEKQLENAQINFAKFNGKSKDGKKAMTLLSGAYKSFLKTPSASILFDNAMFNKLMQVDLSKEFADKKRELDLKHDIYYYDKNQNPEEAIKRSIEKRYNQEKIKNLLAEYRTAKSKAQAEDRKIKASDFSKEAKSTIRLINKKGNTTPTKDVLEVLESLSQPRVRPFTEEDEENYKSNLARKEQVLENYRRGKAEREYQRLSTPEGQAEERERIRKKVFVERTRENIEKEERKEPATNVFAQYLKKKFAPIAVISTTLNSLWRFLKAKITYMVQLFDKQAENSMYNIDTTTTTMTDMLNTMGMGDISADLQHAYKSWGNVLAYGFDSQAMAGLARFNSAGLTSAISNLATKKSTPMQVLDEMIKAWNTSGESVSQKSDYLEGSGFGNIAKLLSSIELYNRGKAPSEQIQIKGFGDLYKLALSGYDAKSFGNTEVGTAYGSLYYMANQDNIKKAVGVNSKVRGKIKEFVGTNMITDNTGRFNVSESWSDFELGRNSQKKQQLENIYNKFSDSETTLNIVLTNPNGQVTRTQTALGSNKSLQVSV